MRWCSGLRAKAQWFKWNVSRAEILGRLRVACLLFAIALVSTTPLQAAVKPRHTLLIMGDSLSAGYGIDVNHGWVALLGKRLVEQGYGYQIINASVSGETSSGGKARLPALLSAHHPDLMILELGANDGLRGLPVAQLHSNLEQMMELAHEQGTQVVLVGIQVPTNYGPAYTQSFIQVFVDLAKQYHVKLVPFLLEGVALNADLMQADNLHPNERAQPRLLDNVWAILRPVLKK